MHKNTDIQCVRYRTNSEYKSEQQVEYMQNKNDEMRPVNLN